MQTPLSLVSLKAGIWRDKVELCISSELKDYFKDFTYLLLKEFEEEFKFFKTNKFLLNYLLNWCKAKTVLSKAIPTIDLNALNHLKE